MTLDLVNENRKNLSDIKFLYLGHSKLGGSGEGGSARIKDMISLFLELGMNTTLITFSFYSEYLKIEHENKSPLLKVITIHTPKKLPKFIKGLFIFPYLIYSAKYAWKCDIIFADFISAIVSFPAVLLKVLFGKPLILDLIDLRTLNPIDVIHKTKFTSYADMVFAISPVLLNDAKCKYKCRLVKYVPIFIDTDEFHQVNPFLRENIRRDLGFGEGEIVIGYAGSFWNVEGIPNLISAFKNIKCKYPNTKLAIIGSYDNNKNCDNVAQIVTNLGLINCVMLIPRQKREDIPKYLSAFDILCCPKIDCDINRAANPVKVIEYLSMEKPTVCSAVGGIMNVIDDGINGVLANPSDVKDLEQKLEWIILNYDAAKAIAKRGREEVIHNYSRNKIKEIVGESIEQVLSSS